MSEDALITREQRGNISVLTMVYRPYNLLGPKLINAIVEQVEAARDAGNRAIVLRSGLRHFSAGADLDIFDKRVEQGSGDSASENRRLNGVEFLRFMELLPIPLIASIHGVCLGVVGKNWFGGGDAGTASIAGRHPAPGAAHRCVACQGDVDAGATL
jgi:enoyl-CoA hydratase/carnithine racemase